MVIFLLRPLLFTFFIRLLLCYLPLNSFAEGACIDASQLFPSHACASGFPYGCGIGLRPSLLENVQF